jgi:hypothetical protein
MSFFTKKLCFVCILLKAAEGKWLVPKFEFGGSFGMSLEEDFH